MLSFSVWLAKFLALRIYLSTGIVRIFGFAVPVPPASILYVLQSDEAQPYQRCS